VHATIPSLLALRISKDEKRVVKQNQDFIEDELQHGYWKDVCYG
jgi:hypothetical protein